MADSDNTGEKRGYTVLGRKYRPQSFSDLVGQEAMVRTLRNAFAADRIAQAFVMTGIRGTGKTTTARIIAKGINCIGADGQGGPTVEPCGQCEHCRAIANGSHMDVLEMDAASNTGVDDIRSMVLDSVAYAPGSARYKIYIIDEVHMLSRSAFNALLKTLEEPPAHVKFIFATTEIQKVPVTVLSRCQRFDLRRIEPEDMLAMLRRISDAEGAQITDEALALIVRASEGSARDAQSLLDQAISHGAGETSADQVRAMLGLADRGRVLDLFDLVMRGDAAGALAELAAQYADGADPLAVLRDLAEATHWISITKINPASADDPTTAPDERARGKDMADQLSIRSLTRMWQMLLKALEEVANAPNAMMAAEMALIRLTHVADLPPPEDLVRKLKDQPPAPMPAPGPAGGGAASQSPQASRGSGGAAYGPGPSAAPPPPPGAAPMQPRATASSAAQPAMQSAAPMPKDLNAVLALLSDHREPILQYEVEHNLRLISYAPGRIEFEPTSNAAKDLASRLKRSLEQITQSRWLISVAQSSGIATIAETRAAKQQAEFDKAAAHPTVAAALAAFPGAKIVKVTRRKAAEELAAAEALPEMDEAWDPFEDED
ncbi:MAG: DNA polymerase III subunit gamma/tau [Mangrovicoccus sp.]